MKPLFAMLIVCTAGPCLLTASNQLQLTGDLTILSRVPPHTPPFDTVQDWRIEMEFMWDGSTAGTLWGFETCMESRIDATGHLTLIDIAANTGPFLQVRPNRRYRARFRRAGVQQSITLWDTETGDMTNNQVLSDTEPRHCYGYLHVGRLYSAATITGTLAFLRWYSNPGPASSGPPLRSGAPAGDMLNLEFDERGHSVPADTSPRALPFNTCRGTPEYTVSPIGPPVISLPTELILRTGHAHTLTAAVVINSDSRLQQMRVSWLTLSAPARPALANGKTLTPTLTLPAFGQYELQVTVTDPAYRIPSATRLVIGAFVADAAGVVECPAGWQRICSIIGPMIGHGDNPWEFADWATKTLIDRGLRAYTDGRWWQPFWDTPAQGTLTIPNIGSHEWSGDGTVDLQAALCGGPGRTTPFSPQTIVLWYNSDDYPGTTGRGLYVVDGCPSATSVHTSNAYNSTDTCDLDRCDNLQYTVVGPEAELQFVGWAYRAASANYYDGYVLGGYTMYLRTGLTKYLTLARSFADRFWRMPIIDRGQQHNLRHANGTGWMELRMYQLAGLVIRALDGRPDMWVGLNHTWDALAWVYKTNDGVRAPLSDGRETGLALAAWSFCAQSAQGYIQSPFYLAADTPAAQHCADILRTMRDRLLAQRHSSGVWVTLSGYWGSHGGTGMNSGSRLRVVHGSTVVTPADGSSPARFNAIAGDNNPSADGLLSANGLRQIIYFYDVANPTEAGRDGDTVAYGFRRDSDSQLTLDRPYEGATRDVYWQVGGHAGPGQQMWMMGMLAMGTAIAADAPIGRDIVLDYQQMTLDVASWLHHNRNVAGNALYNARISVNCEPPGTDLPKDSLTYCQGGREPNYHYQRILWAETQYAFARAYEFSGYAQAFRQYGDNMYQAMFGHPNFRSPYPPDGIWAANLTPGTGDAMLADANGYPYNVVIANKWLGFYAGVGRSAAWPAVRRRGESSTVR